jgi:hypothetical protein
VCSLLQPNKPDDELVDSMLCAAIRGDSPPWPGLGGATLETLLRRSEYHGVSALLNLRLSHLENCPADLRKAIHKRAIARAAWELRHQHILTRVHDALADICAQPVVIKGTALAYTLYPDPMLRARGDTDIIIPLTERSRVQDVLSMLGFRHETGVSGEFISYQASYTFATADTGTHNIDLHWRINNSELLSRLFSYDEVLENAIRLPKLCPHALGLSQVHGLLLACMHRATHRQTPYYTDGVAYYSADRLIWLYDIHLLAESLSSSQWRDFVRVAEEKQLCATCLDGIERARSRFHTRCPDFVRNGLTGSGANERPATYLNASKLTQLWMDFVALDGCSSQLRFLRELFFPPAAYMRSKYPQAQPGSLLALYAHRAVFGLLKRIKIGRQTS